MRRFDLVIFDCDGVLVDSELIGNEILSNCLATLGVEVPPDEAVTIFSGQSVEDIKLTAEKRFGVFLPEDWSHQYYKALITALGERVEPIVGVFDAITTIRGAGCSVCVASQGPVEKIRASLTRVGLWRTFSAHCYSGKLVERSKPFPDLFLHAAHENDVLPSRCAVIEDTETGVRAGIAANMSVFAYCSADKADTMRALGAVAFHSMSDLPHCLGLAA